MKYMYCHHCGKKIPADSSFCHYCGAKQDVDNGKQNPIVQSNNTLDVDLNNVTSNPDSDSDSDDSYAESNEVKTNSTKQVHPFWLFVCVMIPILLEAIISAITVHGSINLAASLIGALVGLVISIIIDVKKMKSKYLLLVLIVGLLFTNIVFVIVMAIGSTTN